jgi:type I restriction enzyme, S subunit
VKFLKIGRLSQSQRLLKYLAEEPQALQLIISGINWFTPTEIGLSKYLSNSTRKISLNGLNNSSATLLDSGSIVLTTRASIGDLGILTCQAATNQGCQSLVVNSRNSHEFLYYLLQTKKSELYKNASGSTFSEISPSKVKSISIQVPPLKEQQTIADALSGIDISISTLESKLQKLKLQKQGMMQALLTGRIRLT